MSKKAFITWVNWQDWSYMSDFLLKKWYDVFWLLKSKDSNIDNLKFFQIEEKIHFLYGDLHNTVDIERIILEILPDEIYNFWWLTSPGESRNKCEAYVATNVHGIIWVLQWIKKSGKNIKLFHASTSEMFGNSHDAWLQTEDTPFCPTNPYAVTKLFGYWMSNVYKESHNLYIVNWILFNHESPLRDIKFVTRKISDGIARIYLWLADSIILGNIDSKRDWWYAADFVAWFWMSLQMEKPDNYIFSTWIVHTIEDFLSLWFAYVWISDWKKYLKIDSHFNRPINLNNLYWKNEKAKNELWWEPKTTFEELVKMMVAIDIQRLKNTSIS